ncbi:nucleotide sugar dehydrogenase [Brevibacterium sp. 5221]|uniref:UDP-glucose 6-dehydrogenase n=1 Tax=Brevibacterium rongguiense TaxID=2695267 RepID=A0A6N9H911_9MICO|nr:UDP-glucose/GDP-mannose dehydrogenase family protein [Brevibacterium rongguiense]MYM20519.1 nucleotide sugar dehydrogenase [Brevibacterium rongguiense]
MTVISVIGCGYLGAVHAAAMASIGHDVIGVDVDAERIAALAQYRPPFFEPGLPELLSAGQESGRLAFTTDIGAARAAAVHFVCVGTPQARNGLGADMAFVDAAVDSLLPQLDTGDLVVGKSTVPVGTAERLAPAIRERGAELAWNPEFLREGHAVEDTLRPSRFVYGVPAGKAGQRAAAKLDEVYADGLEAGISRLTADYATAELVKTAANSFLATKISFINAMAELCEASGADVTVLAEALGMDERIGRAFLNAGLGFGGGCLPKDIRAFMARADELGADQAVGFLREVDAINLRRRERTVDLARQELDGSVAGRRIAVLGASFKPNSDDVRDSPALDVARMLAREGAQVRVADPQALDNARRVAPELDYATTAAEALTGADLVLLLTEWAEYRDLDPQDAGAAVARRVVVDGRNALDPHRWRSAGWTYRALGRP